MMTNIRRTLLKTCILLLGAAGIAAQTVGTVEDCCCGSELATGPCCELDKEYSGLPASCELMTSVGCLFADTGTGTTTTPDDCPSTAVSCSPDLVCPSVAKPDPPAFQQDEGHNSTESCADRGVESQEDCRFECRATGYYCNPWNDINLCPASYGGISNICGQSSFARLCGAGETNEDGAITLGGSYTLCGALEEDCTPSPTPPPSPTPSDGVGGETANLVASVAIAVAGMLFL